MEFDRFEIRIPALTESWAPDLVSLSLFPHPHKGGCCAEAMAKGLSLGRGNMLLKCALRGTWVAQSVKHLPPAQVVIPGSWDGSPA